MARGFLLTGAAVVAIVVVSPAGAATLDDAITAAMRYAPSLAEASADVRAADGAVLQARAQALPQATAEASVAAARLDPGGFFGLQAANITPRMAGVTIEQQIFAGGRVKAGIDAAKAGGRAARAQEASARASLAANVAKAYSDVIVATIDVDRFRQLVGEVAEIERQSALKFRAGEVPSTDYSQARARHAGADAGLAQAEGNLLAAKAHYRGIVGEDPIDLAPLPPAPVTPADLEGALAMALRSSPGLAAARAAADQAAAEARGSRAGRLPTIGAFAAASTVRDQFFPRYRGDEVAAGVRARWTFFDAGRTAGAVHQADARRDAADARVRAAYDATIEGVTAAFQQLATARQVSAAAELQSQAAADALRSAKLEAKVGAKPQLIVLDAERDALAADLQAAAAKGDIVVAAFRLRALLGEF